MKDDYRVSIIIPTKNEEKYIGHCLEALNITDKANFDIEIIIVDNGSSDRTKDIASKYSVNIIEEKQGTIAYLRNLGAKKARGQFLVFIDADCLMVDNFFIDSLKYFENPKIAAVGARPGIPNKSTWVQKIWAYQRNEKGVRQVRWLSSSNFIIRKDIFFEHNGFNEDLITCEDYDLGLRISKKYKLISDERLKSIHLREPSTIKDFFLKELWRGRSNLYGFLSHNFEWQEIPSIIIPFFYIGFIVLSPLLFFNSNYTVLLVGFFMFFLGPFLFIFRKHKLNLPVKTYIQLFILAIIYFFARAVCILSHVVGCILKLRKKLTKVM